MSSSTKDLDGNSTQTFQVNVGSSVEAGLFLVALGLLALLGGVGWVSQVPLFMALGYGLGTAAAVGVAMFYEAAVLGTLTIGTDGVTLRHWGRNRFLRYSELRVDGPPWEPRLVTKDEQVSFTSKNSGTICSAIRAAKASFDARKPASGSSSHLGRSGRSFVEWKSVLLKPESTVAYRSREMPAVLVRVAEDPGAPSEHRVGAALALSQADPALKLRVREAAESTANVRLREAMELALEDRLSERALKKALKS